MSVVKPIYKVIRSIIITVILLAISVYVGLYVALSIPAVQNEVRTAACTELSKLLGGRLEIGRLNVAPFSEVVVDDVSLTSPSGERVAGIGKVAAGIDMWCLISQRRVVLNYAEIIGLDVLITQQENGGPTNIQFLIDALSPKDKSKPPTRFDLRFRNIVVRDSRAGLSLPWMTDCDGNPKPFADVRLSDLRLDLSIPTMKNDDFRFNVRNLQCRLQPGVDLRGLSADIRFRKGVGKEAGDEIFVSNLAIDLPGTSLAVGDVALNLIDIGPVDVTVSGQITPSDLAGAVPALKAFDMPWTIDIDATLDKEFAEIRKLNLSDEADASYLYLTADARGLNRKDSLSAKVDDFRAFFSKSLLMKVAANVPAIRGKAKEMMANAGDVAIDMKGTLTDSETAAIDGMIATSVGNIDMLAEGRALKTRRPKVSAEVTAEDLELGMLTGAATLGRASFTLAADVAGLDKNADGSVDLAVDYINVGPQKLTGLDLKATREGNNVTSTLKSADDNVHLDMYAEASLEGADSRLDACLDISGLNTGILGMNGKLADSTVRLNLDAHTQGNSIDNVTGFIHLSDLDIIGSGNRRLTLNNLSLNVDTLSNFHCSLHDFPARSIRLRSDWADADIAGHIQPESIAGEVKRMVGAVFPSFAGASDSFSEPEGANDFTFDITVKGVYAPYDYFSLPVCPLADIPVRGYVDANYGKFECSLSTPHIRQGRNKLIRDSSIKVALDAFLGMAHVDAATIFPAKKGDVQLALDISGMRDKLNANIQFNPNFDSTLKGGLAMETSFSRIPNPLTEKEDLAVHVDILPSAVSMKETVWNVANGKIDYSGKNISVENFLVEHGRQFVKIDGVASENPDEYLTVKLNDIDLDYIFGLLNINYVTFGGMATGEVVGSRLLTSTPDARTRSLRVKNLSYNGAVLGDGDLASTYFPKEQEVGIYAVIRDPLTRERRASIDGGIWVTRDSLSFSFDANKVNLQLMKPFVSAFCSDLRGQGSGQCKLYGTFSDIDLTGNLRADTIDMKLDFTNTWYHAGGDSVFMGKGRIEVPPLTLYDDFGHTAELSGWLTHTYFHEPVFNFRIRDARSLLCYDTNERLNPLWYGTIFGSGSAQIVGRPGLVNIEMNMSTEENSKFWYVISDTEETGSYSFLSFTDRRKEELEAATHDTIPVYLHQFIQQQKETEEGSSNVILSLKGTVDNNALVTLVMDPVAGDKITARGQGALQMDYNLAANDLRMIGTYVLDEGNYNFSLQDIIIKNFTIKHGSKIQFNGDPMDANLDIAATYRVNTSLTDLDASFASDKELNRTNVPVDALLIVRGPMTNPDIDFDLELPTLTSDVERKVKSIVSTNDMMSRQIIYLLALNRFYTPEYTRGNDNTGAVENKMNNGAGELSSVASSTISSQLSNILSTMTDKLAIAPSFRSDRGDFSDMEFDLALSSRLLNNRLLINGNFGYRDHTSSNTTFVGDFDIEYLLNKNGNLRLKAYNHFNDQSYYIRSALTTQGVGIVWRKDFDRLFNFGRKRKGNSGHNLLNKGESNDSTIYFSPVVKPKEPEEDSLSNKR